jgi:alpha-beta hydrolase superfamily lysophospholipase
MEWQCPVVRHAPRIPIEFVTDKNFLPPGCFIWRRASSASKRLVKVEGMRHQAFQDTKENTARVLQEIAAWLKAQA